MFGVGGMSQLTSNWSMNSLMAALSPVRYFVLVIFAIWLENMMDYSSDGFFPEKARESVFWCRISPSGTVFKSGFRRLHITGPPRSHARKGG